MENMEFKDLTIVDALRGLEQKEWSREELIEASRARIEAQEPHLKAFLTMQKIEPIAGGILSGIPCAVKDVLTTAGVRTTAGSRILEHYVPAYDATCVAKLRSAGAGIMGKTNCDEFALGSSTENSAFYPTHNPHDISRVPGGTSGGSAAAVASGEVLFALGSDTGGSVRLPASFCGCVGMKPTYGRVSRRGLIAAASSLDHVGILAKTCEDALMVLKVIEGKDELDATSQSFEIQNPKSKIQSLINIHSGESLKNIKFGVVEEFLDHAGLDSVVRMGMEKVIRTIQEHGGEITFISLPTAPAGLPCYYIINPSEVSSNLARYDSIRYGSRITNYQLPITNLSEEYVRNRSEYLGIEAKRRILVGSFALSAGYHDQYYTQALRVRARIRQEYARVFESVHFLITPTTPSVAFRIGEKVNDPLAMYLEDIFTVTANLTGVPTVSLPVGWKEVDGKRLPFGLQLSAPWGGDHEMLETGSVIENVLGANQWIR